MEEIKNADIFVNPTYVDTFPTVLIESLACGTPVITYDVGGCKDIVGECGVYVARGDNENLLTAIKSFEKESIDHKAIIERSKTFNRETMINKYLDQYKEVLHGKE